MEQWTAENIPDQTGRIAIITGANSGIGYETARALAGKGATVILACRSENKANEARAQILEEFPAASVEVMPLDLADLSSVHAFTDAFLKKYDRLDLLINNAGVMGLPKRQETADGFEMQFGTNHLGHFALTGILIETIIKTPHARIVNVSSNMHHMGNMNFDDLQAENSYSAFGAYEQSKLANLLFTHELQRKLQAANVDTIVAASHPGWTRTNLQQHSWFVQLMNPIFSQKPPMGALPTLYAATAEGVQGGEYFGPDGFREMRGYPKKVEANKKAHNTNDAKRLWEISEELTGIQYDMLEANQAVLMEA